MEITYYKNSLGEEMVLISDIDNEKSESMTKAEYDRRQAALSIPIDTHASELVDPAPTEKPAK